MVDRFTLTEKCNGYQSYSEMVLDNPANENDILYCGEWVRWGDYDKLEKENQRLKQRVRQLEYSLEYVGAYV